MAVRPISLFLVALGLTVGCKSKLANGAEALELPVTPDATEREIEFEGAGGVKLVGTLMVPAGALDRSYPCVLLLSGSGPTDRDGNQPMLKTDTLRQTAVCMAAAEIATFRFDKRAVATYASQWPHDASKYGPFFSWSNHVADAVAAWNAMRKNGLVDRAHCGLLGHSEGGVVALAMAERVRPLAIVLAATPGRRLDEVVRDQLLERLPGQVGPDRAKALLAESDRINARIQATGRVPSDVPPELRGLYNASVGTYWKQLSRLDPKGLLRLYRGPVLIVNGETDVQVDPVRDAKALYTAAQDRPSGTSDIKVLPLSSHNFKPVKSDKDPGFEGEIVPDFVESVQEFFVQRLGGKVPDTQTEVD
ncbi:MAG: alpha/beta fold hydrolase [Armatimonadetes bacterium]|nr:alpha/beta fold hydrolase [Armatimonadota bacterium]